LHGVVDQGATSENRPPPINGVISDKRGGGQAVEQIRLLPITGSWEARSCACKAGKGLPSILSVSFGPGESLIVNFRPLAPLL